MNTTIKLPRVGENTTEVVIIEVLISPGMSVNAGDNVFVVETDKVTLEIPTPVAGTVKEVLVNVEDEVEIGAPLFSIER